MLVSERRTSSDAIDFGDLATKCAPPVHDIPVAVDATLVVFTVLTVVIAVPQIRLLLKSRSSAGMSLSTLILTVILNLCEIAAGLITKWKQFQACSISSWWSCIPDLLDFFQIFVLTIVSVVLLLLVVSYPPLNRASDRTAAALTVVALALAWLCSFLVSSRAPCGTTALALAETFGATAALCALIQYLPQLVVTIRQRSARSLSVVLYLGQAFGGLVLAAQQIFEARDPWPVWFPFLCSTSMQLVVAFLCLWFDYVRPCCLRRTSRRMVRAAEASRQLLSQESGSREAGESDAMYSHSGTHASSAHGRLNGSD